MRAYLSNIRVSIMVIYAFDITKDNPPTTAKAINRQLSLSFLLTLHILSLFTHFLSIYLSFYISTYLHLLIFLPLSIYIFSPLSFSLPPYLSLSLSLSPRVSLFSPLYALPLSLIASLLQQHCLLVQYESCKYGYLCHRDHLSKSFCYR